MATMEQAMGHLRAVGASFVSVTAHVETVEKARELAGLAGAKMKRAWMDGRILESFTVSVDGGSVTVMASRPATQADLDEVRS